MKKLMKSKAVVFVLGALAGVLLLLSVDFVQTQVRRLDNIERFLSAVTSGASPSSHSSSHRIGPQDTKGA